MAVVAANARQPFATTPDTARASKVLHDVINYLEGNLVLVHNFKSATLVHNAPPPPLRPGDPPMNPVRTATYLVVEQAASKNKATLPPNLLQQLTRTVLIARIVALSTQALAYFSKGVLNAAKGFQALHLKQPQQMLQKAAATVQQAWAIHGQRRTSLPAAMHAASQPYYGDNTDHLVRNPYRAHTATRLHRLLHNDEQDVREVFTLTLREAQYHCNTCPQYILHERGLPTMVGTCIWNQLQLLLPHHQHVIQTNHRCRETGPVAILHTDLGGGLTGSTTTLDLVGTTVHLVRVTPNQMRALQRVGTYHVAFLQHPDWFNKSALENHMRTAARQTGHSQPTDGEVCEVYGLFWSTHKQPQPRAPPRRNQAHNQPMEQVDYAPGSTVPAVLLLAPDRLKTTLRPARQLVDATAAHRTQLLPAVTATRRADRQPHHLLEMWAPSAGHSMAPPPTAGTLSPHTNGRSYPGTAPIATYTLRPGLGGGRGHYGLGTKHHSGKEIPPWSVGHNTSGHYLPGAGQTPQYHARGPLLPG